MRQTFTLPSADRTRAFGAALAAQVRGGDLLILVGDLGSGKTTFTQGLGQALGVKGRVTSPTFIIARTHRPGRPGGLGLIHVDAYRLGSVEEIDALDLETEGATNLTVVEWGEQLAPGLNPEHLILRFTVTDPEKEIRQVELETVGPRWEALDLAALRAESERV